MKYFLSILIVISTAIFPSISYADFFILLIKKSDLPYSLSPDQYSNSESSYSNSISNYSNSASNYENSSSNYDNSPTNYKNGRNGKQRLLFQQDGQVYFVGYYVFTDDGLINFYSPDGDRLFYSPAGIDVLFDGENGNFCGAIVLNKNQPTLAITEKGQLAFSRAGVSVNRYQRFP